MQKPLWTSWYILKMIKGKTVKEKETIKYIFWFQIHFDATSMAI